MAKGLTRTQLKWIVLALQHEIVRAREEMDAAVDDSPIAAVGECVIESRQELINQLEDMINGHQRSFAIK